MQPRAAEGRFALPVVQDSGRPAPASSGGGLPGVYGPDAYGPDAYGRSTLNAVASTPLVRLADSEMLEPARQYGVLPWRLDRKDQLQILLITSLTSRRWIVPKGWPMNGRAPFMAAALEAFEEAGVIGDITPGALTEYSYDKVLKDGTPLPCLVTLFSFRVRGTLTHWQDAGRRQRQWFSPADAAHLLSERELAEFVRELAVRPELLTEAGLRQ